MTAARHMTRLTINTAPTTAGGDDWRTRAICGELDEIGLPLIDPEVFFPGDGDLDGIDRAKAICALCPVAQECLDDELAIEGNRQPSSRHGIRGGKTGGERHAIYRNTIRRKRP